METKFKVTSLSHDDLVDILSTGTYESDNFILRYNKERYESLPKSKRKGDSIEDKCADLLLHGWCIEITDLFAEGESYGKHIEGTVRFNEDGDCTYTVWYDDFIRAASTKEGYELLKGLLEDGGDYFVAWNFLQILLFGDIVYG